MMRAGIALVRGWVALDGQTMKLPRGSRREAADSGARQLNPGDDYAKFIIPPASAARNGAAR
jgi:hypothetical protein